MSSPLVTVVIAMYNCRPWIADAIRSVQQQTYRNWELVVVDDGSTDGGHEVVENFLGDTRIHLVRTPNRGPSAARNAGVGESHGEFVTFLDADDILLPQALSSRVTAALSTGAKVAFSRSVLQVSIQEPLPSKFTRLHAGGTPRVHRTGDLLNELVVGKFMVAPWALLMDRKLFDRSGGFDPEVRIHEDAEFLPRLLMADAGNLWVETYVPYYVYRRHPRSSSAVRDRKRAVEVLRTFAKIRGTLATWFAEHPEAVAEALAARCVQCWPYWTDEHRAAMREAFALANGERLDLTRFVGGPKAQAIARVFGWRAGRLANLAWNHLRRRWWYLGGRHER